ncbi:hypothetical protein WJA10_001858 [Klebsiella pneumoniae]|uniref:hypothetical protein n=2 Tax=Klebsiella pneumoniae TaxID=573 RepID=UPI001F133F3E|nr:hypothetical protein [Klebsiella pneumoniae]MDS6682091.1 hypothetical protein [Klebsiella pneumoniae]UWZ25393.1 hypothetical protein N4558_06480 [Klebsiella pneumoniae]UXI26936.1 hypothetical protein N4T33_06475 [Klebsiella pneumoniae]
MNIETVNELIQSLESAGKVSIREQKFLKLAKAFKHLAAENVALKKLAPAPFSKLMMEALDTYHSKADDVPELAMLSAYVKLRDGLKTPATDRIVAGIKADGVESGIKTIMTMLNHQAPGVSDAINVLRVHSSELRAGADK